MSFSKFIKSLLPRLERSDVNEDARITLAELVEKVIPSFESFSELYRVTGFKHADVLDMAKNFTAVFERKGFPKQSTFIGDLALRLPMLQDTLVYLQGLMQTEFSSAIATQAMTARQAFIMRAICNISFMSRYSLNLLNYISAREMAKFSDITDPAVKMKPAEVDYIERNFVAYCKLFSVYAVKKEDLKKTVSNLPDVVINPDMAEELREMYGVQNIDPTEMAGVSGFIDHPIYSIRMIFAKWQNDRYEASKEKKAVLELRLMYLEMMQKKEKNPQMEYEITKLQSRIEILDRKLREAEADVGL